MNTIPDFNEVGNLPSGTYRVTLKGIKDRFTWNKVRKALFEGPANAVENLITAGVKRIWIDGSFITRKDTPNDIDGCWSYAPTVDIDKLDKVFLDLHPPREAMRIKYGVDFLIAESPLGDAGGKKVIEFFQIDREGNPKGILLIEQGKGI